MRRGLLCGTALGLLNAGLALLAGHWLSRETAFGWYAYSPMPRRYADYSPPSAPRGWLVIVVLISGFVIANAVAVGAFMLVRARLVNPAEPLTPNELRSP
jgi:heme/copper-type cytochrome/quinol oxidase subunit 1